MEQESEPSHITRAVTVPWGHKSSALKLLRQRARLSLSETSRWWQISTTFSVTGSREDVECAIEKVEELIEEERNEMRIW